MKTFKINGVDYLVSSEREFYQDVQKEVNKARENMIIHGANLTQVRRYKVNINGVTIPLFNPATGSRSKAGRERLKAIFQGGI